MAMEESNMDDDSTEELSMVPLTTSSQPVDNAISKIEELANKLVLAVEFSEGQRDFQELASSLIELEGDRLQLHNDLEIQTINASVKRHALTEYPAKFQKELNEAVLAARLGNEENMKTLQAKLANATSNTDRLQERHRSLQEENSRLSPERNQVTKQHDEIIATLNQRMADKAGKQIKLNEGKDALRDTVNHLGDYDIGMQNLKDDMAEFQKESRAEEEKLLREVAETQDAIEQQKQKNSEEKRTTDTLADSIMEMNGKLNEVQKDIRRTENSHTRLEMQSMQLNQKVERERLINQQTAEEIEIMTAAKTKQEIEFRSKIEELESKILKVQGQISIVQTDHDGLSKVKDNKYLEKEDAARRKAKELARVKEISIIVQATKQKTTLLIEKAALLSQENEQYVDDLKTLDENHKATIETYNLQITDYRENLNAERQERMKVQDEREETEKALDEFRNDQLMFMNDMTKKIEEGRRRHKLLASQSAKYNDEIAKNKQKTLMLSTNLDISQRSFETMKSELEMEIERLKTSIELFKSDNQRKQEYLAGKGPLLIDLEAKIDSTSKDYTSLKNEVVAVRNKQKSVQDSLKRTQLMLSKLANPRKKLKSDIFTCRESNLGEMKNQADERKILEAEIYDRTMKLENIVAENEHFKQSCEDKMYEVEDIKLDIKSHGHHQASLHRELEKLLKEFMGAWDICLQMEKESSEHDAEILKGIDHLQKDTKNRSNVLTEISDHLQHEMESLTGFLDNVNSRRPIDTRQQKRSSVLLRSGRLQSNRRSLAAVSSSRLRLTPVPPPPSSKPSSIDVSKPLRSRSSIATVGKA